MGRNITPAVFNILGRIVANTRIFSASWFGYFGPCQLAEDEATGKSWIGLVLAAHDRQSCVQCSRDMISMTEHRDSERSRRPRARRLSPRREREEAYGDICRGEG